MTMTTSLPFQDGISMCLGILALSVPVSPWSSRLVLRHLPICFHRKRATNFSMIRLMLDSLRKVFESDAKAVLHTFSAVYIRRI